MLFQDLSFTDDLIKQHLSTASANSNSNVKLVPRDPSCYRDFIKSTYFSKDQEDPFTHFLSLIHI